MGTEELYQEREKRLNDAISLRVPDRVPIMVSFGFFTARYAGFTNEEVMYDPDKLWEAQWKTTRAFPQDAERDPYGLMLLGPILDMLSFQQIKWAGGGLPPNASYQFVEGEYMKAEEYDHFLLDPSDFIVRVYLPRICGKLGGLAKMPSLHSIISCSMGLPYGLAPFSLDEVQESLDVLKRAGAESVRVASYAKRFREEVRKQGFPLQLGGFTQAPFDTLKLFRGTKGVMLDMYQKAGEDRQGLRDAAPFHDRERPGWLQRSTGNPRIFIPTSTKASTASCPSNSSRGFSCYPSGSWWMVLIPRGSRPVPSSKGIVRRG